MTKEIKELPDLIEAFKGKMTEIDAFVKTANDNLGATDKLAKDAVAGIELSAKELKGLGVRIAEIEQKQAEAVSQGKAAPVSLGMQFAQSDLVKDFIEGKSSKVTFINKDGQFYKSTNVNTDSTTAPDRQAGIIPGATRKLKLRDLIASGTTGLNSIETTRESSITINAAETAEGASKPQTDIVFDLVTTNIRTIAHWLKLSTQILADAPTVASYIDLRLAYGVEKRIDSQIVNGDATGVNLSGMTHAGNFTAYTPLSGTSGIDSVAAMIAQLAGVDYDASGILMNPADWWAIQTLKGTTNDHYIFGDPHNGLLTGLWGLPVVATNAMAKGKLLVADFDQAYFYWNRQGTIVQMFEQDDTNVQKNLVTVRGEARGALETRVPAASLYGSITL